MRRLKLPHCCLCSPAYSFDKGDSSCTIVLHLSSEYDQPESIIERIEDLQEKRTSLTKVWMQLTDAEQELLYRKYVLEQTTEELAGIFQCSRDSIRMRLSRVRRKSLRLMKGDGTNDETRTTVGKL